MPLCFIAWNQRSMMFRCLPLGSKRTSMSGDLKSAGIEKKVDDGIIHIHALRHSLGTHLSMAGGAPRTAQKVLRHSNLSLTMGPTQSPGCWALLKQPRRSIAAPCTALAANGCTSSSRFEGF